MWILNLGQRHLRSQLLSEFIDGRLSQDRRRRVKAHLAACSQCREEMDSLQYAIHLLKEIPAVEPRHAFTLVEAPVRATRPRQVPVWAYSAATTVAVAFFAILVSVDLAGVLAPEEARVAEPTIVEEAPLAVLATQQATPSALAAPIQPQADQPEIAAMRELEVSKEDTVLEVVVEKEVVTVEKVAEAEAIEALPVAEVPAVVEKKAPVDEKVAAEAFEAPPVVKAPPVEVKGDTPLFWHVLEGVLAGIALLLAAGILWRRRHPLSRDCPDQTDSSNHVTLWDGSSYKRAA